VQRLAHLLLADDGRDLVRARLGAREDDRLAAGTVEAEAVAQGLRLAALADLGWDGGWVWLENGVLVVCS